MTETMCPCCGAKCEIRWRIAQRCDDQTCKDLTHQGYNHKCPDMTKLREVYEKHLIIVDTERANYKPGVSDVEEIEATILDSGWEVLNAVKELLEENK